MLQNTLKHAKNILCIRLDNIGDVLMTTPAFRAVKQSIPDARLTLLTSTRAAQLDGMIPEIDAVIPFNAPWLKQSPVEDVTQIINILKAYSFDAAIIFTVYSQSSLPTALLCYQVGIPYVVGYAHENPYSLMTHWIPDPEPARGICHEVERQLALVAKIGCFTDETHLSFSISKSAHESIGKKLCAKGIVSSKPWIIVHPGASEIKRMYPMAKFSQLVHLLVWRYGYQVVLTGSQSESGLTGTIVAEIGDTSCISLAGLLSLEELAALIENSSLLITNNTGPAHIAAALGSEELVLYARTNPQHTPWNNAKSSVLFFDVDCTQCARGVCSIQHEKQYPLPSPMHIAQRAEKILRYSLSYEKSNHSYSNY